MNNSVITNNSLNKKGGLFLAVSILISSMVLSWSFYKTRQDVRYVNVRGLSEREVSADMAIWPIVFSLTDNDLGSLQKQLTKQQNKIIEFLKQRGFKDEDITHGIPDIDDNEAKRYNSGEKKFRYTANNRITLRSSDVHAVEQALQQSDRLLAQGIVLVDHWDAKPKFIFTNLNDIKPDMIKEANKNAREAAEQFAKDSDSKIKNIRHATQGLFSIEDTFLPTKKKVRVVTNVQYSLKDN